jgi:polyketide biosynthesis enoyl-CoA hydratase PksH
MELIMFDTLLVSETSHSFIITIHRPQHRNSINSVLLKELHQIFDKAEQNPACRFIILQGENGFFCTGMDFQEITKQNTQQSSADVNSDDYMKLLKRFSSSSKIVISLLDGQVLAGGVGIVAASDIVISTDKTQFGLSEALWGLLPACVLPFLIRRIGFQKAYYLTLTTQSINSRDAHATGLIDELTENPNDSLRKLLLRLTRVQAETVKDLKAYFRKLWIINEEMEKTAVAEITRLIEKPQVQNNIKNFIEKQQFPWESSNKETV